MTNPYGGLRPHPLAECFPMIEGEAYARFRDLIRTEGLRHPIILHEGMILDGRNRKKACQELGIPCAEVPYTGSDPAGFVWSENADGRRHLDKGQLALAAEALATAKQGGYRQDQNEGVPVPLENNQAKTISEVSKTTGVPERSIKQARRVVKASPEAAGAVQKGDITLKAAERVAKAPEEERPAVLREEIKKAAAPRKRAPKSRAVPQVPPPKPKADPLDLAQALRSAAGALININRATPLAFFKEEIKQDRMLPWDSALSQLAVQVSEMSEKIRKAREA